MRELTFIRIFDNSVSNKPHRPIAELERGRVVELGLPVPAWIAPALSPHLPQRREFIVSQVLREGQRTDLVLAHSGESSLRLRYRTRKRPPCVGERVCLGPAFEFTRARDRAPGGNER
jgi:hypothetical protein